MKKQAYNRKQATSLAQVSALMNLKLISAEAKAVIAAYLAQDPEPAAEGLEVRAPEAAGYEFRSNGVIDMLSGLH